MSKNDNLARVVVRSADHEHNGKKCEVGDVIEVDASLVPDLEAAKVIEKVAAEPAPESAPAAPGGKRSNTRQEG